MKQVFKALAALLCISFIFTLSSSSMASSDNTPVLRRFVVYYGWYFDEHGNLGPEVTRIINSAPDFVISPYHTSDGQVNLRPDIMNMFHNSGIKVMAYIATGDSNADLATVKKEIEAGFNAGTDGIMLDEVSLMQTDAQFAYYKQIYDYAKQWGGNKTVIANPGSILVDEKIMQVSDIVSFEHQWKLASSLDWFSKYPSSRFMGISSNDVENAMGYTVGQDTAARDTISAWQSGIGYHYSTDSYTQLPSWFESYQQTIQNYSKSASILHQVNVKTFDNTGKEISGLWIEVKKGNSVITTGFSPAKFSLPDGAYQIGASSYQSYIFSKWSDGNVDQYRIVQVDGAGIDLAAQYRSENSILSIQSHDTGANPINGMYVEVTKDGSAVAQGYTPFQVKLPPGSYTLSTSSYKFYQFVRWDESGSPISNGTLPVNLVNDTTVHAQYSNQLVGKVGTAVFHEQCIDNGYENKVVDSIQKGGALAGALELYIERNAALAACAS